MLKLKRVELQGFKSFCDRTEMRFNGLGIAAIVGPNGCGKSNLSDAISWVLGEQSARTLRGNRMEDVIFAGTGTRKPVGLASVTITLMGPAQRLTGKSNGNGHSEDSPQEITVTRRLFRSGESEYLIDGRAARLRDIQDIFMGTGLGPESYAIIEQGRIGQILSSKPQDRRAVIEEAAGITRFKTKRRLAEAKLEGAKQNLSRVFDILEEVTRQVNSLKRQAAKARRFEELKSELTEQLRRSLSGRFRMLEREAARTALELNLASAECKALSERTAAMERDQAGAQERCYAVDRELTEARRKQADLRLEEERSRGRLELQARQIGVIEQRLGQGENELQEFERRHAQSAIELEAAAGVVARLEQETGTVRQRLTARSEEREKVQQALREREQALEAARRQVLRLLGESSGLKNQLAQIDEYLSGIVRDETRIHREEESAGAELERLGGLKADLSDRAAARQAELEAIVRGRREVEEELSVRKGRAAEGRRRLEELRGDFSRLKARRDSLQEILSHRAYTTESVKKLFTAVEQGQTGELKPMGVLADFVEVDRTYEKAAEEFLRDELEYVVVADWKQADRGIDLMRADLDGRATFLVHPLPGARFAEGHAAEPALGPETGIVSRLSAVLRMTNGLTKAPAELLPRLARCFLAEDRQAAQRLALQYPDLYFLLADGVCYHGHAVSGGKKTGSGPLALKRELREVAVLVQARQKEIEATAASVAELESEITALSEDLEGLRARQQHSEKESLALEHEARKLNEDAARVSSRLSVARGELARLAREAERAREQRERNAAQVEEKERARAAEEQRLEESRRQIETLQAEAARVGEEQSALRVELAGMEERRRAEQATQARLSSQVAELARRRQDLGGELERLGVERARLLTSNIELDRGAALLAESILAAGADVNRLAALEQESRAGLTALEEDLRQARVLLQGEQQKRSQIELELVRRQAELKYLDETARKELHAPLEDLASGDEIVPDEDALAETENRCNELRTRVEALGPVNTQALEEYQEAQQRYDFLNAQRQDLIDSIRDTEKAIHDIDAETRRRFAEAFEAINANFRELFRTLFRGGTGEMRLTDEANIGESGIDLVASPPGKRLQNVLLLSGGEKALTAIALLMAIFRYQPSPFCVLDEVDAPLDEANIERLMRLLAEMSSQTQFIIITHAKRTMEAAQSLYGVTMQEPGVSKLVSVKFQPAPEPPPPPAEYIGPAAVV